MELEDLKKELTGFGFVIDGDVFYREIEDDSNVRIVNGHVYKSKVRFTMKYIGEGCQIDDEGSEYDQFHQFDILDQGGERAYTICIRNLEELKKLAG